MNHRYLLAILSTITLSILMCPPSNAATRLNCQSEIYQQATADPKDRFKKGYCFVKVGQYQQGVNMLNSVGDGLPELGDYVLYFQGAGYENLGDYANASTYFNKILTQYPDSGLKKKTLARLGTIYTQSGDYINAERIFRSLYSEETKRSLKASYLYGLAEAMEKQGRYQDAMATYRQIWVEYPETKSSGEAKAAATNLSNSQGIAFVPTQADYLQRANILFDKSRCSSALNNYNKVSSKSAEVRTNMGICMVKTKRYNEAENVLKNINSPRSLFWRGKLKTKLGLDSQASAVYTQIHNQFPNSQLAPEGLYNAARLYQINGQTQQAIRTYDILIRSYPRNKYAEDGAWNLGWIYYRKGQYREAHGTFSAFIDSESSFNASNAKYWRARTLEKQGKLNEANVQYRELAGSTTPTYHTYMAQKKSGYSPAYPNPNPETTALNPKASKRKQKAQMLISLGMPEEAQLEIVAMEEESRTKEELVVVSLLYSQVEDYYQSIKVAQGLGLPQANRLSYPKGYQEYVAPYSKKYGVDELLVYSIIREESRFQKDAVSPADARGLMQMIPPTARTVARQVGINGFSLSMLTIPRINIEMGIFYFKQVLDQFDGDVELALASYNAGPHRAADWKVRFYGLEKDEFIEEVPFRETRNYIRRILRSYGAYKAIYGNTAQAAPVTPQTTSPSN
ncbi:MAG: transglycosylase SLT domain-containing protein [Thermodesulfobacteriota bacterium]